MTSRRRRVGPGQLLATETPLSSARSSLVTTPSSSSVALSWTAAAAATNYRVDRKTAGGSYSTIGPTAATNFTDNGAAVGSAYLYRVCAADGGGNCTSGFTNIGLGARVNFPTDPTITSIAEDPTGVSVTAMKAAHITELRTAVNALRSLAGLSAATWTHPSIATGDTIYKDDVQDLRDRLNDALIVLGIQTSVYTDPTVAGAPNGTLIKAANIRELRERTTSGVSAGGGGTTGGLQYALSDLQGSARAVMNNNGAGTSTIIARHDYFPFGPLEGDLRSILSDPWK